MRAAERGGVGIRGECQFVHERLDREDVAERAECAQRTGADRRFKQQMTDHALSRQRIHRHRVAIAVSEWLGNAQERRRRERILQMPGSEQIDAAGLAGTRRVRVAPHVVLPVCDAALRRQRGPDAHRHRGTDRRPREFVVAHPLQLHGTARDGTCEQRRIERHVVRAVVAIAARTRHMHHIDGIDRHAEHRRKIAAQRIRALRIRPRVIRFDPADIRRHGRILASRRCDGVFAAPAAQCGRQCVDIGKIGVRVAPAGCVREHRARGDCLFFTFCGEREKIAVTDHRDHAWHRPRLLEIDVDQRGARARRTHHAAEQHAGQAHVLHKGGTARELCRQIDAWNGTTNQPIVGRLLDGRIARHRAIQQRPLAAHQVAVAHGAAIRRVDHAGAYAQCVGSDAELPRRCAHQHRARLRARGLQRRTALFDGLAAVGVALVRATGRVGGENRYAREVDVQLLRGDLRERSQDALPEFGLAREDCHVTPIVDANPAGQSRVFPEADGHRRLLRALRGRLRIRSERREREQRHQRARLFAKAAARWRKA
ncbi:conserved hypothetical protein [Ricinus communis]|uniref:Uncharacterized protein n=1 Tax=Ricinus communis TaxID=3988 RepID=B9TCH5_RICCO|nr:conserved hypothetical protein [Ricinus communis]